MSVIALTKNGAKKQHLTTFLNFLNDMNTQSYINEHLSTFSPNHSARIDKRPIILQTAEIFEAADYQSQYYDLEFEFEMSEFGKKAFAAFIKHKDVKKVTQSLEQKRQALYNSQKN